MVPAARYKVGRVHVVPLPPLTATLLQSLPRFVGTDWIFTVDGHKPMSSFTRPKHKLDEASGVTGWTLHDLRRTGRTIITNLEVADETAARVLGNSLGWLMATYNVSRHRKQKMAALVALEADLLRILGKEPVSGHRSAPLKTEAPADRFHPSRFRTPERNLRICTVNRQPIPVDRLFLRRDRGTVAPTYT
jgi:hypothetical protein